MAENKQQWPPIHWLWQGYERNLAWYSGDPQRIRAVSAVENTQRFWNSDEKIKVHVPIAANIVSLAAGMIFSESPKIECEHKRTSERIDEINTKNGTYSKLLQAAELCGVCGGVFLSISWNQADGYPKFRVVPANCGLPEWRGGELFRVKLWDIVKEDEHGSVWRTEETYTNDGHIKTRLLKGDENNLGAEVSLQSIEETKHIKPDVNSGTDMLLAVYVPNMLPNRERPHVKFGRSDFDSLYGLFDELDEMYSAMQRETRLTKTTVIVPAEYLRKRAALFDSQENIACKPDQWVYSNDTGAFVALDIDSGQTSSPITVVNPEIRAEQRIALCDDVVKRIWQSAGYSPQSTGMDVNGRAESGTALSVRERSTIRTTETKKTHWWHGLHHLMTALIKLDAAVFRSGIDPNADLTIELPSNAQPDISQMAEILEMLERAGAISTEMKIELLHPDWDEEKRAAELERIRKETGAEAQRAMDRILNEPDPDEGGEE